jgi:hypothetical protein
MFKKILMIVILLNVNILFIKDLKPVVKYNTIPLQQKVVKQINRDNFLKISKISKKDQTNKVSVSYDFGVNWIEENDEKEIIIYPNPTLNGEITIKLTNNNNSSFSNINLFNKEGNLIKCCMKITSVNSLRFNGLNKGIYYLNVDGKINPIIVE